MVVRAGYAGCRGWGRLARTWAWGGEAWVVECEGRQVRGWQAADGRPATTTRHREGSGRAAVAAGGPAVGWGGDEEGEGVGPRGGLEEARRWDEDEWAGVGGGFWSEEAETPPRSKEARGRRRRR